MSPRLPSPRSLPRQRALAQERGLLYYRGSQCKYGHPPIRYVNGGDCVTCANLRASARADAARLARKQGTQARLRAITRICRNETCKRRFTPQRRSDQMYCSPICCLRQAKRDWKQRNKKRVRAAESKRLKRRYATDSAFREKARARSAQQYHAMDTDSRFERNRQNRERADPEVRRAYFRNYHRERSTRDVNFRIATALRARIRAALKSKTAVKSASTLQLIGCDIATLRMHLEAQFEPWMNWRNYGRRLSLSRRLRSGG